MEVQSDALSAGRCRSQGPIAFLFPGTHSNSFMGKSNFVVISLQKGRRLTSLGTLSVYAFLWLISLMDFCLLSAYNYGTH